MRAEPETSLAAPVISVPSDPSLYKLVDEDRPSDGERHSYARTALQEMCTLGSLTFCVRTGS